MITSPLFAEREQAMLQSIAEKWPHRHCPVNRWHLERSIATIRSIRGAQLAYSQGCEGARHAH